MKAIRFAQYGESAKVLTVQERPLPAPRKGEVRVRILASPINPSDLLFVRGQYAGVQPHFPASVCFEGVGIVDALGPQVHRPVPGQRVVVLNFQGATGRIMPWSPHTICFRHPTISLMSKSPVSLSTRLQPSSCSVMCWPSPKANGCFNPQPTASWDA